MPNLNKSFQNSAIHPSPRILTQWLWNTMNPLVIIGLLFTHPAFSGRPSMAQTKTSLQQLETKITKIQHILNHAKNKHEALNQELASTEKEINIIINQLRKAETNLKNKQKTITTLQEQINTLNKQRLKDQTLLAKHLRARYMMGEYQPLKWLLNQNHPSTTSRLLTYYQYVVQSDQTIINQVRQTQNTLALSQKKIHQEINDLQQLQLQLKTNQKNLVHNKNYHMTVVSALYKDIQNKQQQLLEYQQNKKHLSQLLQSLTQEYTSNTQRPFAFALKKLPQPLHVKSNNLQKMNQGLIFFAKEGTPVTAVYPGKIVFSDWLKGYGLLLIIDHGRGFMTLYAHNESLFKQKGDLVNQGEQIASVGHTGGIKQNGLYFEIRQRGKAVPPLRMLS